MKTAAQVLFWGNAAFFFFSVGASMMTRDAGWAVVIAQSAGFMAVANYFLGRDE